MKLSFIGESGLLLDMEEGLLSDAIQERIWALAKRLDGLSWCHQAIAGVNNLLVTFDPLSHELNWIEDRVHELWAETRPDIIKPKAADITVDYDGEDLNYVAQECGLTVENVVAIHTAGVYRVAAIGAMPGYPYLTGLDARLTIPRRSAPRFMVKKGSVLIAAGITGIMPCSAPSGWHIIGHTLTELFLIDRDDPLALHLGDIVRFRHVKAC